MFKKLLSQIVIVCFFLTSLGPLPQAHADSVLGLPAPGTMINLSPAYEPVMIKGLTVHKDNPFLFDFIVDVGQDRMSGEPLKQEGEKLIKYFLASLTIPDRDRWVNLSPYEKKRMIPEALSQTDMGRDLLEQDYILKQITASLIYPEKKLGKTFWDRVYSKTQEMYGTTQIPVNTFNKVWIMADRAEVFEHNQTAFVVDQHLKVMLEEDYLALQKHSVNVTSSFLNNKDMSFPNASVGNPEKAHSIASNIIRAIILPELEKEVNTGKNFANLRQIFNSVILATWYKKNLKEAVINQVYTDQSKVKGINTNDPTIKDQIYEQYLKAYKKGVFNYIKEDVNAAGASMPHKYFSGGTIATADVVVIKDLAMGAAKLAAAGPMNLVDFATVTNTSQISPGANQPISNTIKRLLETITGVNNTSKPLPLPLSRKLEIRNLKDGIVLIVEPKGNGIRISKSDGTFLGEYIDGVATQLENIRFNLSKKMLQITKKFLGSQIQIYEVIEGPFRTNASVNSVNELGPKSKAAIFLNPRDIESVIRWTSSKGPINGPVDLVSRGKVVKRARWILMAPTFDPRFLEAQVLFRALAQRIIEKKGNWFQGYTYRYDRIKRKYDPTGARTFEDLKEDFLKGPVDELVWSIFYDAWQYRKRNVPVEMIDIKYVGPRIDFVYSETDKKIKRRNLTFKESAAISKDKIIRQMFIALGLPSDVKRDDKISIEWKAAKGSLNFGKTSNVYFDGVRDGKLFYYESNRRKLPGESRRLKAVVPEELFVIDRPLLAQANKAMVTNWSGFFGSGTKQLRRPLVIKLKGLKDSNPDKFRRMIYNLGAFIEKGDIGILTSSNLVDYLQLFNSSNSTLDNSLKNLGIFLEFKETKFLDLAISELREPGVANDPDLKGALNDLGAFLATCKPEMLTEEGAESSAKLNNASFDSAMRSVVPNPFNKTVRVPWDQFEELVARSKILSVSFPFTASDIFNDTSSLDVHFVSPKIGDIFLITKTGQVIFLEVGTPAHRSSLELILRMIPEKSVEELFSGAVTIAANKAMLSGAPAMIFNPHNIESVIRWTDTRGLIKGTVDYMTKGNVAKQARDILLNTSNDPKFQQAQELYKLLVQGIRQERAGYFSSFQKEYDEFKIGKIVDGAWTFDKIKGFFQDKPADELAWSIFRDAWQYIKQGVPVERIKISYKGPKIEFIYSETAKEINAEYDLSGELAGVHDPFRQMFIALGLPEDVRPGDKITIDWKSPFEISKVGKSKTVIYDHIEDGKLLYYFSESIGAGHDWRTPNSVYPIEILKISRFNDGITSLESSESKSDLAMKGGIDLNTANGMQWKDTKEGNGVEMDINPAMIAQIRHDGVDRLSEEVLSITAVTSIWPIIGIPAPVK